VNKYCATLLTGVVQKICFYIRRHTTLIQNLKNDVIKIVNEKLTISSYNGNFVGLYYS
jgi:hypothetical protein